MITPTNNIPTIFAAFGATGDLMRRKVIPAVYHLYKHNELPRMFRIIGFSRREWSDEQFRAFIKEVIEEHQGGSVEGLQPFLELFRFQRGYFEEPRSYKELKAAFDACDKEWGVCSNKLFYLSVAPEYYGMILGDVSKYGLADPCAPGEGWTHVIVEKPFGMDSKTAKQIDELLGKLFQEDQIYRIDHYLAKEMLQNILTFRFSNNLFEIPWGSELIESIHIKLLEKIGVEKRGAFYDSVGAFRDVGQNHLLQMLALVTMDAPAHFEAADIQQKRAEILRTLPVFSAAETARSTFRAQHEGYREIPGVAKDSQTETYFKVRTELAAPKWAGVPITMESGKRMGEPLKEIVITFKHPMPCLCPPEQPHHKNEIIIRMEPREEILIEFWSKKLGFSFTTEKRMFHYMHREATTHVPYVEEYAKLLLDCIRGDQTLFISTEEIRAMWRFTDPILASWHKGVPELRTYTPDVRDVSDEAGSRSDTSRSPLKKEMGIVGLGKMGSNMARRLLEKGWIVHGYDPAPAACEKLAERGMRPAASPRELVAALLKPRIVWLMVPAGKAVDDILFGKEGILKKLAKGDIVIDGGNSYFKDSITRAKKIGKLGIKYIDVGFSGGPGGARSGGCLMVGGDEASFKKLEPLFRDLSRPGAYRFFPGAGAGHFVKMVHNGIEYGMMQSLGEGFALLKGSPYKLDLARVADIYNNGSVIESRLVGWLKSGFEQHGENLADVSGAVGHSGEGEWTAKTAKEMGIEAKIIEESFKFRVRSSKKPGFIGKIVSVLREQFGGHAVKK